MTQTDPQLDPCETLVTAMVDEIVEAIADLVAAVCMGDADLYPVFLDRVTETLAARPDPMDEDEE